MGFLFFAFLPFLPLLATNVALRIQPISTARSLPMAMTQDDIRAHYETDWRSRAVSVAGGAGTATAADSAAALVYSNPVEDAVLYPIYEQLLLDHKAATLGGRILDIGAGSGRWLRFFGARYQPAEYVGVDFTKASIDLLEQHASGWAHAQTQVRFAHADITDPSLPLRATDPRSFDIINIANVLFHIPEPDKFARAMDNLKALLAPGGMIVTTEYLPHRTVRTEWMLVRSRDEFAASVAAAGLKITDIRATGFFSNDPCGITRDLDIYKSFNRVRVMQRAMLEGKMSAESKRFVEDLFAEIEKAAVAWAKDVVLPADMPSQKLVVLRHA